MSKMKASLASAAATSLVVVVAVIVFVVVLRAVNNIIFEMRYFYKVAAVVCHSNDSISIGCFVYHQPTFLALHWSAQFVLHVELEWTKSVQALRLLGL